MNYDAVEQGTDLFAAHGIEVDLAEPKPLTGYIACAWNNRDQYWSVRGNLWRTEAAARDHLQTLRHTVWTKGVILFIDGTPP